LAADLQFDLAPLEFVGEISYGVYLMHNLFFDVFDSLATKHFAALAPGHLDFLLASARFLVVALVTIACAWLSRWYFEEPFLKLKERFASDRESTPDVGSSSEASVPATGATAA